MSQLSRLIEQARTTRRVNEIFKIAPATAAPEEDTPPRDPLMVCLSELEGELSNPRVLAALSIAEIVAELEAIARELAE